MQTHWGLKGRQAPEQQRLLPQPHMESQKVAGWGWLVALGILSAKHFLDLGTLEEAPDD